MNGLARESPFILRVSTIQRQPRIASGVRHTGQLTSLMLSKAEVDGQKFPSVAMSPKEKSALKNGILSAIMTSIT